MNKYSAMFLYIQVFIPQGMEQARRCFMQYQMTSKAMNMTVN